jgi:hypothetical protein
VTESEIRRVLRELCDDLDRAARRVILPAALGAGMALAAGCGGRGVPASLDSGAGTDRQGQVRTDGKPAPGVDQAVPPPLPEYMPAWRDARPPDLPGPVGAYGVPMYMMPSPDDAG